MYGQLMAGGKQFVHCREVVLLSECPLSEVLLYIHKLFVIKCTMLFGRRKVQRKHQPSHLQDHLVL